MEINRATIKPSDVGLKEWDAFYHPELLNLNHTQGVELSNSGFGLGTKVTMGALVLMLNSPLQESHKITINTNTEITTTAFDINKLITCLDAENIIYESEIQKVIQQDRFVDDKALLEQEIIDAYMKEVEGFYPKKRKIVL